jgi:hypothetical protein
MVDLLKELGLEINESKTAILHNFRINPKMKTLLHLESFYKCLEHNISK